MYNSKSLLEVLVSLLKAFVQINNEHYAPWYKLSEHQVLTELKKKKKLKSTWVGSKSPVYIYYPSSISNNVLKTGFSTLYISGKVSFLATTCLCK